VSIQKQVIVRHRSPGHLRLQLPPVLRTPACGFVLVSGLQALEGVYRVHFLEKQGKLSIHFLETDCTTADVAACLYRLIDRVQEQTVRVETRPAPSPASGWRGRLEEIRETVQAGGVIARQLTRTATGLSGTQWLGEFMNDLLMLYLIKMHWPSITQLWLPHPWRYRYEWTATFYLIYLHVKSKLPKPP